MAVFLRGGAEGGAEGGWGEVDGARGVVRVEGGWVGGGWGLVAFVGGVGGGGCGVGGGGFALFGGVRGGRGRGAGRGWSLGGGDLLGEGAVEFVVFFVFRGWWFRGSSVVSRICDSFEDKIPISGCCLMSSRPGLRPSWAATKAFSQSINSERSFCEYSGGLATSSSIVMDIVVVAQLAWNCAGLGDRSSRAAT